MDQGIDKIIEKISIKHFDVSPFSIERFETGLCNEVYKVILSDKKQFVFRLNKEGMFLKGSEKYIPVFKSLGIKVPNIIASDYSKKDVAYCYQILDFIPGQDIGKVFEDLTEKQLEDIAKEIANIFKKTRTLSTDGSFGWVNFSGHGKYKSWTDAIHAEADLAIEGGRRTGVLNKEIEEILLKTLKDNRGYFGQVKSKAYFDDIATKNVLIEEGRFSGLVDIDGVHYGDFLEAVGRIKADFIDKKNGEFYIDQVEKWLGLNESEKKIVNVYALLNRIFWSTGNGIQFNQNSTGVVNKKRMENDHKIIIMLYKMIENL